LINKKKKAKPWSILRQSQKRFHLQVGKIPESGSYEIVDAATPRGVDQGGVMADWLNLAMLILATIGAMAFGILAAYAILRTGFALMRPQSRPVALKVRPEVARIS
jgi:hypothetical protein